MMDGGAKDLPLGELATFTKQRMKRKKTTKVKEPVAAVRKSTRPRKQTQRVLESADSQNEVLCNPPKKQRTNSRRLNKIDYCRNGQPFMCSACESQVINNSVAKARIKLEKFPIEKERDGHLLQLCVKCAMAMNNFATKGPTQEEREEFEEEGRQFGEHWAELLGDSDASRLYCAYVASSKCGCIQSYITGTLVAKKRKSSYSVTDSEGTTPAAVRTVGTSSTVVEPKVKDGAAENIQRPADQNFQLAAGVPLPPDGVLGPLSEADQMERARHLLSLLKESISKKKSHKKRKHQSQKPRSEEQLALQKKSLDTFILTNRAKLKSQGFCDRGCKKVLCYSNNFLHKKSARSEPRLQRTKGGIGQGRVPDLCDLPKVKCCDKECSKIASKQPGKVAQWRLLAQKSQKDMWSMIGQMLSTSTDDLGSKVCSKFIVAVTGCCQTTINRVNFQKLLTKVDAGKPEHGMKSHWKRQRQDSRSYDVSASSIGTTNTTSPVGTISGSAGFPTADSARILNTTSSTVPLNPTASVGPLNPIASVQVSAVFKTSSLAASLGSQAGPATLNNQSTSPQWSTIPAASGFASSIAGLLSAPSVTTSRTVSGVGQDTLQAGGLQKFPSLAINEVSGACPPTCQIDLNAPGSTQVRPGQEHPGEDIDQKMERLKEEISQKCLNLDNPEAIKSLQELVNELAQTQRARDLQRLPQGPGGCSPLGNGVSTSSGQWTTPEMSGHALVHSKVPLMIPAESASTTVLSSCHKGKDAVTVVTSSKGAHPGQASRGSAGEAPTRTVTDISVPEAIAVLSSNISTVALPQTCKKFVPIAPKSTGLIGGSHVFRQLPEGVVPGLVMKPSEILETSKLGAFQIITTPQFASNHQAIGINKPVASTQGANTPQPVHTSQLISSSKLTTASVTSCTFPSVLTMNAQPESSQALTSPNDNAGKNLYALANFHPIHQSLTEQPDLIPEDNKPNPTAASRREPGLSFSTFIARNFNSQQGEAPPQSGDPQTKSMATPDISKHQSIPAHSPSATQGPHFGSEKTFVSNCSLISSNNSKENCPQAQTMRPIRFGQQGTEISLDSGQYVLNSDSVVSTSLNQHLDFPNSSSVKSFSDHQTLSLVTSEYQQSKLQSDHNFQLNSCGQQNHQTYAFSQDKFVTCGQVMQSTSTSHQAGLVGAEMPSTSSSESLSFDALAGSPVKDNSVLSFCTSASENLMTSDHLTTWLCPSATLSSSAASSALSPGAPHPHPTTLPSLLCKMLMETSTTLAATNFNPPSTHTACGPAFSLAPQGLAQDSVGFNPHRSTSGELPSTSVSKCYPSQSLGPVTDDQSHLNEVSCSAVQSTNTTMALALNQSETLKNCHMKVGKVNRARDPPQVGIVNPYISGVTSTPATFANFNLPQSSFTRASSTALETDHVNVTLEPVPLVNFGETNISRSALNMQNVVEPVEQPHLTSVLFDSNSLIPSALAYLSQQCNQFGSNQLNAIDTGQLSQQTVQLNAGNLGPLSKQTNQLSASNMGQLLQQTNQLKTINLGQLSQQTNQLKTSNLGQLSQQTNQLKTSNLGQLSQQTNHLSTSNIGQLFQQKNPLNASNQGHLSQQANQHNLSDPGQVSHQTNQFSLPAILSNPSVTMLSSDNSGRLSQNHPSGLLENPTPNVNLIPKGIHRVFDPSASNSCTKQLFVLPSGSNISTGGAAYYSICPLTHNLIITPVSFPTDSQLLIQQGNQILVNVCPSSCSSSMPTSSSSQGNISVLSAPLGCAPSAVSQAPTVQSSPTQNITSLAPMAARQPAMNSENDVGEAGNFLQSNCFIPISQCSTASAMGTSAGSNAVEGDSAELLSQARDPLPVMDRFDNVQLGSRVTTETNRSPSADGNPRGTRSQLVEVNSTQVLRVTSSKAESNSAESTTGQVVALRHQEVQFENQISGVRHSGMTSVLSSEQKVVDVKMLVHSKQAAVEERFITHLMPPLGPMQNNPSQSEVELKLLTASQNGKVFVAASGHQPGTLAYQPLTSAHQSIALTRQSTPSANQPPVSPHQQGAPPLPTGVLAHQLPAFVHHRPTILPDQPSLDAQSTISRPPVSSLHSAQDQSVTPTSPSNTKQKPLAPRHDSLQQSTPASSSTENISSLSNNFLMPLKVLDAVDLSRLGISQALTEQSSGSSQSEVPGLGPVSHGQPFNKSYNSATSAVQLPVAQTNVGVDWSSHGAQANVDVDWSSHGPVFKGSLAPRQVLPTRIQDNGSRLPQVPYGSTTPQRTPKLQTAQTQPISSKPYPRALTPGNRSGKTAENDKFQPDSQNSALLSQLALILQHSSDLLPGKETIFTIEEATNSPTLQTLHSREMHLQRGVKTLMIVNDQYPEMLSSTEDSNLTCGKNLTSEDSSLNQLIPSDFLNCFQVTGGLGNIRADTTDLAHIQKHPTFAAANTTTSVDKSNIPKAQFMPASGQYHVTQSQVQGNKQDIEVNYLRGKDVIDLTDDSPPNTPTASMGQHKPSVASESQLPLTSVKIVVKQNHITRHVDTTPSAASGGHNSLPHNTHQEVMVQKPLPAHQHHGNPQLQQEQFYQKQAEYHCLPGEKRETQRSLFSDRQEFKTIPQYEMSDSRQQSSSTFNGSLTELSSRINTTPIFFLSPQTGTANSRDDSQLNSFQTLDEETARQLLSSIISQANCPQLFMEPRNAQTHDDQFSDLLLSVGPPQHSETQVSGIHKAPTSNDFPRVTISLNQECNQSDQVLFTPPQTQSSQSSDGAEPYFTHAGGIKLLQGNVSSSSSSLLPQSASGETSRLSCPQHSVSSWAHNKNSTASIQMPQMSASLLMPSKSLPGMSFPMASPVNGAGSSSAVSFSRATNTPKGAVGPPNITVLSPSKPMTGQLPRARSESNSASAVFTVVSQANATANSTNLLSDNRGSSDTGLSRNLMRSNSSTCTQFNISSSSIVSRNSTNVSRHQETVSQAVPPVTSQSVLPSSTKTKEALVKLTEAQARQPAKPKKRPTTISELLKLQNHPVMGTYVFKGSHPTSEQKENPAVGHGPNIEVKNLQLISRSNSNPDRTSSASVLPCDPPGIKVLQPNTASVSTEAQALSKHVPQTLADAGPTTMLTLQPVLQLPHGQPPVTFNSSRPVADTHTALPKLMIAPSVTNASTNSATAQAQSGLKMQLKAPGVVFTDPCSNSSVAEKCPQVLKLQSSSSADSSIQKKETLSLEPKMRLINHTQVSSAPTTLNSNSTVSYFGQKIFTAVGQKSGSNVSSEKLSLRPSTSFNSEEGLADNQIHKFKLTGNQLNEAKFGKNSIGQGKNFLSFGQKFSSPSPSLSGAGHKGEQGPQLSESKLCSNNSQLLQLIKPKYPVPSVSSASELPASPQGNPDLILKFPTRRDPTDAGKLSMAVVRDGQISGTSSYHSRHQLSLREQSQSAYGSAVLPVTSAHEQIHGMDGSMSSNRIQKNPLLANILFENKTLVPSDCGPSAMKKLKQAGSFEDTFQKSETTLRTYTSAFSEKNGQPDSSLMNESQVENQKSGFCYPQGEVSSDPDHGMTNLTGTTPRASKDDQYSENYGDLNETPMTASSQPQVYQSSLRNLQKISACTSTFSSHHSAVARSHSRAEAENLKTESAPSGRIDKVINDIYNFHEEEDSSSPPILASSRTQSAHQLLNTHADGSQQCFASPKTFHCDAGRSHVYIEDLAKFATVVNKSDKHILEKSNMIQCHWDGAESSDWRNPKRPRGQKGNHKLNSKKVQFSDEVTDNGGHALLPSGHAVGDAGKKQPLNASRNVQGFNVSLTPPVDYQSSPERGEFLPHYLQNEQRPVEAISPDGEVALSVPQHQEVMNHALSLSESSCVVTEKHLPAVLTKTASDFNGHSAGKFKPSQTLMEHGMTSSEGPNPSLKIQVNVGHSTQRGEGNDFPGHRYKPCPAAQETHNEFKTTSFQNELSSFNILSTKGYSKLSSKRKTEIVNSSQWSPTSGPTDNNLKLIHNIETMDNSCTAGTQIVRESTALQRNRWPERNEAASHGTENERRCSGSPQRFGLLEVDYETAQQMPNKRSSRRPEATLSGHSVDSRDVDNQTGKGLDMAYVLSSPSPGLTQETYSENQNLNKEIQEKMDENKKLKKALALAIRDHNLVTQGGRENAEKFHVSPVFDKTDLAPYDLEDSRKLEDQRKRHASSSTGNAGILKHSPLPEAEMAKLGEVFAQRPWQTSQMTEQELQFSEAGYRGNTHGTSYSKLPAYAEGRSPPAIKDKDPLVSASCVGRPSSRPDMDTLQYENARRFQSLSSKNSTEVDGLFLHLDHSGRHRNPSSSQRAQDVEPPPYDMSHRHRNPSASSVKSAIQDTDWFFEPLNRSRNPSSSSWLTDFTSIRSRNPSGSSNRRSRPGSSNSDREFNLTDEFSFFLTDLGRTRSRNSSGESIEGHIWQSK